LTCARSRERFAVNVTRAVWVPTITGGLMNRHTRIAVRLEVALATIGATLFVLTLIYPRWIEALTGLEPDSGSGAAEFLVAGAFLLMAICSSVLAWRTRRRLARQPSREAGVTGA
jgi:hypothetical protein